MTSTPLPEQGGFDEKLTEILSNFWHYQNDHGRDRGITFDEARTAIENLMSKERLKGVRDGYSYAYTAVDLATSLSDASKRVYEGHKRAAERCDD